MNIFQKRPEKSFQTCSANSGTAPRKHPSSTRRNRWERRQSLRRSILSGASWGMAGRALGMALGLAANVLLARLLPPAALGNYVLAASLAGISQTFAQMGLQFGVVRMIAEAVGQGSAGRARAVAGWTLKLLALSTIVVALLIMSPLGRAIVAAASGSPELSKSVGLVAVLMVSLSFEYTIGETFRGLRVFSLATICGSGLSAILATTAFAFLEAVDGRAMFPSAIVVLAGSSFVAASLGLLLLSRRLPPRSQDRTTATAREVLAVSWPFYANSVALILLRNTDVWALSAARGSTAVAIYLVASRIANNAVTAPMVMMNSVVPPVIAELYARGEKERLERVLRVTATAAALLSALVLAALVLGGGPLLGLLFGDFYRQAYQPLVILAVGNLLGVAAGSCGFTLGMTGQQKALLWTSLLAGVVSATAAVVGARVAGANGAAFAFSLGNVLQNGLQVLLVRRRVGVRTQASFALTIREGGRIFRAWRSGRL
ncbi:MAG: oligosaccharide flippase family protein [Egibacteraceae bacterium]